MRQGTSWFPSRSQWWMVVVAAFFTPARIWVANRAEIGFPDGLILWAGLMTLVGFGLWSLAVHLGYDSEGVTNAVFWGLLAVGSLGTLIDNLMFGMVTLIAMLTALILVSYRLRRLPGFRYFTFWVALSALMMPVGLAVAEAVSIAEAQVVTTAAVATVGFLETPDVVIVVLDGHGSLDTLERLYGVDASERVDALAGSGLTVVAGMRSNYTVTHLSLASFFEMGYPMLPGVVVAESEWGALLNVLRGDNHLVDVFKSQGYRFVVVESGWSGIQCTEHTDVCVTRSWPDDATSLAIRRSMFRPLQPGLVMDGLASGSIHSIRWLEYGLKALTTNKTSELIFVHLMLPHPPLHINDACEYVGQAAFEGNAVGWPGMPEPVLAARRSAYAKATDCAERVILATASAVRKDGALLMFLGDHGPDSRGQLQKRPNTWHADDIEERLQVLFVTNSERCDFAEVGSLVNVGRELVSCLDGHRVDLLEDRYFLSAARRSLSSDRSPMVEVGPSPPSTRGR